jgi:hypothetical protein
MLMFLKIYLKCEKKTRFPVKFPISQVFFQTMTFHTRFIHILLEFACVDVIFNAEICIVNFLLYISHRGVLPALSIYLPCKENLFRRQAQKMLAVIFLSF